MRASQCILVLFLASGCGGYLGKLHPAFRKAEDTEEQRSFKQINCEGENVKSIEIEGPDGKFKYSYEYFPAKEGKPTVVAIPGGPGQSSIGSRKGWLGSLPDGYGVMMTDPRGVGCNAIEPEPSDKFLIALKSEDVARDILKALDEEDVSKYILYGVSYGTVVATMAGSFAGDKLHAVVLEGVLGSAYTDDSSTTKYNQLLATALDEAGSDAKEKFNKTPLPLDLSENDWMMLIFSLGRIGTIYSEDTKQKTNLLNQVIKLATSDSQDDQDRVIKFLNNLKSSEEVETPGQSIFYAVIACTEIWSQLTDYNLKDGAFERTGKNLCADLQRLKSFSAYDSAKYQIKAPVYYFQGTDDPATVLAKAEYHFDSQTSSSKQFFGVNGGGHNPIQFSLEDCSKEIWEALNEAGDISAKVQSCGWNDFTIK
jgi:pimeloyl-ACP methyl ester carboxylesterase